MAICRDELRDVPGTLYGIPEVIVLRLLGYQSRDARQPSLLATFCDGRGDATRLKCDTGRIGRNVVRLLGSIRFGTGVEFNLTSGTGIGLSIS